MLQELNAAITDYDRKWEALVAERKDRAFFEKLRPTAVGWKATDLTDFDKRFAFLRTYSDQVHLGWVNERWVATFHLRNQKLTGDITLVKLMQLRPGSKDHTGLDHLDFFMPSGTSAAILKTSEPDLNITEEKNGTHCKWISVWFEQTEAKLRSDTVLDVCIAELEVIKKQLQGDVS